MESAELLIAAQCPTPPPRVTGMQPGGAHYTNATQPEQSCPRQPMPPDRRSFAMANKTGLPGSL